MLGVMLLNFLSHLLELVRRRQSECEIAAIERFTGLGSGEMRTVCGIEGTEAVRSVRVHGSRELSWLESWTGERRFSSPTSDESFPGCSLHVGDGLSQNYETRMGDTLILSEAKKDWRGTIVGGGAQHFEAANDFARIDAAVLVQSEKKCQEVRNSVQIGFVGVQEGTSARLAEEAIAISNLEHLHAEDLQLLHLAPNSEFLYNFGKRSGIRQHRSVLENSIHHPGSLLFGEFAHRLSVGQFRLKIQGLLQFCKTIIGVVRQFERDGAADAIFFRRVTQVAL
jgi:hypothetical protein